MPAKAAQFHITAGKDLLSEYESSPGKIRYFCSRCGSGPVGGSAARAGTRLGGLGLDGRGLPVDLRIGSFRE